MMKYNLLKTAGFALPLLFAQTAAATVTYDFAGDCTVDCSGADPVGRVHLVLTDAYTPGTALTTSVFMSLRYDVDPGASTILTLPVNISAGTGYFPTTLSGTLPDGSGAIDFTLVAEKLDSADQVDERFTFLSDASGAWSVNLELDLAPDPEPEEEPEEPFADAGSDGVWTLAAGTATTVPEPASLSLFGVGAVLLYALRRRRGARLPQA